MHYSNNTVDDIQFEDIDLPEKLIAENEALVADTKLCNTKQGMQLASLLPIYDFNFLETETKIYRFLATAYFPEAMQKAIHLMVKIKSARITTEFCYLYLNQLLVRNNYSFAQFKKNKPIVENLVLIAEILLKENAIELFHAHEPFKILFKKINDMYSYENLLKKECGFEFSPRMESFRIQEDLSAEHPSIADAIDSYNKFTYGSEQEAFNLGVSYTEGTIDGEGVDEKSALMLFDYAAKKHYVPAMSACIELLIESKNYDEAIKHTFKFLNLFSKKDRKFTLSNKESCLMHAIFKLLTALHKEDLANKNEVDEVVKLCKKASDNNYFRGESVEKIYGIQLLISLKNDPTKIIVAMDSFIENTDFKIGQYQPLWKFSQLIESPLSIKLDDLDSEFPWMKKVTQTIKKQIMAREFGTNRNFKIRPILLVGLPGGGKTTYCKELAKIVNVPFRVCMAAGSESALSMRGTPRGYATATPGFVPKMIAQTGVANGLILVDEIDKCATNTNNGSMHAVMLQLLEPATSMIYYDEALEVRLDLSHMNWIATANSLASLPKPLLGRFEVILAGEPDEAGFAKAILRTRFDYAAELGIDERMLPSLNNEDVYFLTSNCRSLREISKVTRSILEERMCAKRPMMH